jgi:hypothetical protein
MLLNHPGRPLIFSSFSCMSSCMATKTISLELDAYEKLRQAKRPGESFSQVVRRARLEQEPATGAGLLARMKEWPLPSDGTFAYWERALGEDGEAARISASPWEGRP